MDVNEIDDDTQFYVYPNNNDTFISHYDKGYARFKLLETIDDNRLSYKALKDIGIRSQLQGPISNLTQNQIGYIEAIFDSRRKNDFLIQKK